MNAIVTMAVFFNRPPLDEPGLGQSAQSQPEMASNRSGHTPAVAGKPLERSGLLLESRVSLTAR
jgi:hypothetical protein